MIGWFDGHAGASGDMFLGALVGAGVPIEVISETIASLDVGVTLRPEKVDRGGTEATRIHVEVPEATTVRRLPQILDLFEVLDSPVQALAATVFERLARAEAAVHGVAPEQVHFHEVGALDSIADVVGAAAGLVHLELARVHCSPLSLGSGAARGAHGPLPVPAPAVLELLRGEAPVQAGPAPFESTTPTGAALMASVADEWGPMPAMTVSAVGAGAGSRDPDEVANALRLVVGEPSAGTPTERALQYETNVDDLDPRLWPSAIAAVLAAGAHDAWVSPITMKKGRPALMFCAVCPEAVAAPVRAAIFGQTSTIGLREIPVTRHVLDRRETFVVIGGQRIRVKIASHRGEELNRSVEWDDVSAAAEALGIPAKEVLALATGRAAAPEGGS